MTNIYKKIIKIYKEAAWQSHYNHFDRTSGGGLGCPECIRASKLRKEAERLIELYGISLETETEATTDKPPGGAE